MAKHLQPEAPQDRPSRDEPQFHTEELFRLVRGTYDEEGELSKVIYGDELQPSEASKSDSQMDKITTRRSQARLEGLRAGRAHQLRLVRDRFERRYSTWIPFSAGEMSLAVTGLSTEVNKVVAKINPNILSMTKGYYDLANKSYLQAAKHIIELEDAKVLEQDIKPSPDRIRRIPEINGAVADYIQAKQYLERLRWGQKRGQRKNSRPMPRELEHQEIMDGLVRKSDEELIALWERAMQCANSRSSFWKLQIENAIASNELLRGMIDEQTAKRS